MENLWNDLEASKLANDLLSLRVYTSRLIGREPSLVLHGGGNTSVKISKPNLFGKTEDLLLVKGSGWDLATIEPQGFSPVKMEILLAMAQLEHLSDSDMVRTQRAAMTDPSLPTPSVETILHAVIPFRYVDHTHADAVVALTNSPGGQERVRNLYGDKVLIVPYVMPGFILARKVFELTRDVSWQKLEGMVLMNHGIFSFGATARESYERMIKLVTMAETVIQDKRSQRSGSAPATDNNIVSQTLSLSALRKLVSKESNRPMVALTDVSVQALEYAARADLKDIATRGPLTPDHVIHTKRTPLIVDPQNIEKSLQDYVKDYSSYFARNATKDLVQLDPAPRWVIWPGVGSIAFGPNPKRAQVVLDIARHTMRAIKWAETLGGWQALPEKDVFDVEYWELEQAKLKVSAAKGLPFEGKIVLITGAASGIGKACVQVFQKQGAAVIAIDINPDVTNLKSTQVFSAVCDLTDSSAVGHVVDDAVKKFGGIDIVVSNAGSFPAGKSIEALEDSTWKKTLDVNLNSHFYLLRTCTPFLKLGLDPAVVIIGSKNVPAPGPGAAVYSAAKAGLTQLARVAALELGKHKIRINVIHPNAVFDTGVWTHEVLKNRASHYGLSIEQYKTNNVLGVEVTSNDVAELVLTMAGPAFLKTTGAQVAIDGGNDRVI